MIMIIILKNIISETSGEDIIILIPGLDVSVHAQALMKMEIQLPNGTKVGQLIVLIQKFIQLFISLMMLVEPHLMIILLVELIIQKLKNHRIQEEAEILE